MRIAYTMSPKGENTNLLLAGLAQELEQKGLRTCGIVQINAEVGNCHPCDMDVRVLPDGPVIRISQSLGREARGCRLDPAALEEAVVEVADRIGRGVDVLIINKFGKHEAEGRGFRDLIADALSRDVPVITSVNDLNKQAFLAFTEGLATKVPPRIGALLNWVEDQNWVEAKEVSS